jgi:5-methylcytosine-specific restriction endonuclease McrA
MAERRSYRSRRRYLIEAVRRRRKKVRQMAIDLAGGECQLCGYRSCAEALEFHHIDDDGKDFAISDRGHSRSWARVRAEISKCALLCANCHREVHAGVRQIGQSPDMNTTMAKV